MKLVPYYRMSTQKQGRSGLGLDAQRMTVEAYAARIGARIEPLVHRSGERKNDARLELAKALHLAKVAGFTLTIAKLDRLSRNAAFLLTLCDSGVRFIAADMADANELTVGIMALVAQQEREAISRRTREALEAAKRRSTALGNPNGACALRRANKGNADSVKAISAKADQHAQNLRPVIKALGAEGVTTLAAIARELNDRGMLTARGGAWHESSVANLLARLGG
jgi:DNA invertase Pin-like site-specific DNA recombinase